MKKLNTSLIFAIMVLFFSCQKTENIIDNEQKTENEEIIVQESTEESKLNGQFILDLTMEDKNLNPNSRAYMVKKGMINSLNIGFTFYGNGNGVDYFDDGSNQYMTKKMIEERKLEYAIKTTHYFLKENKKLYFSHF